jgi:hypothetical protein
VKNVKKMLLLGKVKTIRGFSDKHQESDEEDLSLS